MYNLVSQKDSLYFHDMTQSKLDVYQWPVLVQDGTVQIKILKNQNLLSTPLYYNFRN